MHRIEAFGLRPGQMDVPDGTNLESRLLDALKNRANLAPFDGIGLDNRQRPLTHPAIIAGPNSATVETEAIVTPMGINQQDDPDVHKGVVESDRPNEAGLGNPSGDGIDENGLPDDPVATAQDEEGANADKTQG